MSVGQTPPVKRNLFDDHEASTKKQRISPAKRDTTLADRVQQRIRCNFKGWDAHLTDGLRVEGLTLRERLAHDLLTSTRYIASCFNLSLAMVEFRRQRTSPFCDSHSKNTIRTKDGF